MIRNVAPPDSTSERPASSAAGSGSRPQVLVVDDSDDVREMLAALLRCAGYDVREAGDGRAALRSIATSTPDAIVLDLWMPVMDGWDFLRRLRRLDSPRSATPVVAVTADRSAAERPLAVEAVLTKPFAPASLLDAVEAAVA